MNINIRNEVMSNLSNIIFEDLEETVKSAISSSDENTLPGLGVIFEIYWNNCSLKEKKYLLNIIYNNIK